jgi:hypothetical protein
MPYFVFSVKPFAQIEKLAEFSGFREASVHAKALRAAQAGPGEAKVKVMFADSEDAAIELLCRLREPGPTGDD